jgi:hypothetical protein
MSIPEGSDTATVRWTSISTETGAEVKVVTQGTTDTVVYTRTFDADSLMATSAPFTPPQPPGSAPVINRAVGRLVDGKLMGTFVTTLAATPDSVVMRGRWEATRAP